MSTLVDAKQLRQIADLVKNASLFLFKQIQAAISYQRGGIITILDRQQLAAIASP